MAATFDIRAVADAQALSRLIEYFAMRAILPACVSAERQGAFLGVKIELPEIEEPAARIICEKMRSSFLVEKVTLLLDPNDRGDVPC